MAKKTGLKKSLMFYMQMPLILAVLLVVMNIYIYFIDKSAGYAASVFVIIYIIIAVVIYLMRRPAVNEGLIKFAADYGQVQRRLLRELDIPYAVCDGTGHLLWANEMFSEVCGGDVKVRHAINSLFPEITEDTLPEGSADTEVHVSRADRNYRTVLRRILIPNFADDVYWSQTAKAGASTDVQGGGSLIAVYLYDETEIMALQQANWDQKLIVGLLYIDNYEEALESIDEVRRSLLTALVDRKINKFIQGIDAIIKKIEKDKYFFVFKNEYLATLTDSKFSILDEVRTVNIGNETAVTISIGLGVNADSFTQGYDMSRAAIDLALGRGGDQVVIRDGEKVQYFGGKSGSVEKSTRVKARVKAHALREFMDAKDTVLVMGHSMADVDSFGAAVGVYRIAKTLNKKAYIVLSEITNSVRVMMNRFKNNPEYGDDMIIGSEQAQALVDDNTMLVVVDVNRPSFTDCPPLIDMCRTIVILDHHRQTDEAVENPVLSYIEPYASSACEMVAEILQYISDSLKLRTLEADAMYAGIMIDTNNFLTKTGVRTFEAAAYLRRNGADATRIRKMFRTEIPEYMTKAKAMATTEVKLEHYAFAKCYADPAECESPTVLGAQVANELMNITNIKASFVFTPYNDKIYISARSIDELNVQVVMEKLGGGGHMSVAGAQLDCTIEQAMDAVEDVLRRMTEGGEI